MSAKTVTTKNAAVRITDEKSLHCGRIGVVQKASSDKTMVTVALLRTPSAPEAVVVVARFNLKLDVEVSMNELEALYLLRADYVAEQDALMAQHKAEWQAKAISDYLAERTAKTEPLVREERSHGIIFGERRDGYVSERITIYTNGTSYGANVPKVEVNWSALGSVSPERALAMATALAAAALEAMAIRSQKERELGIVVG